MTDRQKASALTGLILVWCAVALPVDRYLLHDHAPWFSDLLVIKNAEIVVQPLSRTVTWVGLTLALVVPAVLQAVGFAIHRAVKYRRPVKDCLAVFGTVFFWFFTIPLWVWIGDSLYRIAWAFLTDWEWAKGAIHFLDGFVLNGDVMVYSLRLFHIEAGFGAMTGLALGVTLFFEHGLWDMLQEKS